MNMFKILQKTPLGKAGRITAVVIVFLATAPLFSANVTVPSLEIYSWGRNEGSGFQLDSYGDIQLQLDGGYKFGGNLQFGFTSQFLETAAFNDMLTFKSVSITLQELFNIPLSFSYFIGQGDTLASGEIFGRHFGIGPIESQYTNFFHFPTTTGIDFDFYKGIHTIYGTGGKFELAPTEKNWLLSLYLYQDSAPVFIDDLVPPATLDYGHASLDIRSAFNWETVKLEAFLGATYPTSDSNIGYYRTGVMMYAGINDVGFLAQIGIPLWKPLDDAFSFDLFYLLIEQRVRLGSLSEVLTVLWRPSYYHQDTNTETGIDINLDVQVGGSEKSWLSGGIEGNFVYQLTPTDEIRGKLVPYLQIATSGVVYEVRASTKIWPFDLDFSDMFEIFLSINASF